ncbi:hypothetical protein [Cereibacter johrii]|uniref:hypothetical protein n=1 Tax=Cereibacter johrii TaxID=445629 RepID=UPI00167DF447|nr:hypothetical protein [Cereibacter johrii]
MQDEAIPSHLPLKMPGIFENPMPGADGLEHLRRQHVDMAGPPGARNAQSICRSWLRRRMASAACSTGTRAT